MENEEAMSPARPSISFPLGLVLLLLLLFGMSSFFTCFFHWEKVRSFILPSAHHDHRQDNIQTNIDDNLTQKSSPLHTMSKQIEGPSFVVAMPGDEVPKFVAMECPFKPSTVEKLTVIVHKIPT